MERSRLVEKPVDRQAFFLTRRSDRTAFGGEFDHALSVLDGTRWHVERPAPAAARQGQAEREQKRADRREAKRWTGRGTHCAPLLAATHTTDRVRQARGKVPPGRLGIGQALLFTKPFQPLRRFAPHISGRSAA